MRASIPRADIAIALRQIEAMPEIEALRALFPDATPDLIEAVLGEAARFGFEVLDPLNAIGDVEGCRLEDGRVRTPRTHREAWTAFTEGGWTSVDLPEEFGGQGLPQLLALATQEAFDRHCAAFGMTVVPARSAARLIRAHGTPGLCDEWLPHLVAGDWGATICISEPGAGSDVQRVRTTATQGADGWRLTGEKCWISFGDQDLSARIGHCVIARTAGARGLSLFLVPDHIDGVRNGIFVRRLEEKLGLHLSPTCALGFEEARGILLGTEGRGLQQMFVMITNMRLAVGGMGLGIAAGACDVARAYAEERRQGGTPAEPPVPIATHPDVQRQLLDMAARVDLLRGLLFVTAAHGDLGVNQPLNQSAALVGWLLPIIKTLGGEIAFSVASDAIQVLGGAGYTCDWPVEQLLRDARVLPVFEGTTGMQGLDLLHRQLWRGAGAGLETFRTVASPDMAGDDSAREVLRLLTDAGTTLAARQSEPRRAEAAANAFLDLAGLTALTWIAARNAAIPGDDPASRRLRATARFWLDGAAPRAAALHAAVSNARDLSDCFDAIRHR